MKIFSIVTLLILSACSTSLPDLKYADGSNRVPINLQCSSTKLPQVMQTSQEISFTDQDKRKARRKCPAPNRFVDRDSHDQILVLKISTELGDI